MVHVHRDRPPAGDPVRYIRLLGRIFFQVVAGVVVVVLHLGFLQIIVSNNKDDTEVPVRFVSWFFHLERTDPIGYETWKRFRLLLFPTSW